MSSTSKLSHIYNPANQSDQELLDGFIMRGNTFATIMQAVKQHHGKQPPQHFLIEAQRGMGKTSLLLRTRIEIKQDASLAHLLPVQLAEEQYGIFQLCQLWEHIADELCEQAGFENLVDDFEAIDSQSDYAENCYTLLENYLTKNQYQLVLMLDNFGDVLKRLTEIEQDRLHDILHCSTSLQLIATSAKALEATYKHDNSLFELFEVLYLKGLDKKHSHTLLKKLAKTNQQLPIIERIIKNQPERIESLRQLTGGVPRTLVILYEIFVDDNGSVFEDLESILDRVTPLYKDRMDDLPKQQQAIMNALALNWDGISTKEITAKLNNPQLTSKKIASQLNQLEKNGLVTSKRADKKNKLYFLQERFFNIWYLMRYGRKKSKSKVLWLIRFFQSWYSPEELKQRAQQHIQAAQSGELHPRGGILMAETLRYTVDDLVLQDEVVQATRKALSHKVSDINQQLSKSDRELIKPARKAADHKDFDLAIKRYLKLIQQDCTPAMVFLAYLYQSEYKDYPQAIHFYQMAVDKGHAHAMFNLVWLYYEQAINKQDSLTLAQQSFLQEPNNARSHTLATVQLWNHQFKESLQQFKDFYQSLNKQTDEKQINRFSDGMTDYLILLLSKQPLSADALFKQFPALKQQFKPVYYALMTLLKAQYPKEYLRMGSELEETVEDILKKVKEKAQKYA